MAFVGNINRFVNAINQSIMPLLSRLILLINEKYKSQSPQIAVPKVAPIRLGGDAGVAAGTGASAAKSSLRPLERGYTNSKELVNETLNA